MAVIPRRRLMVGLGGVAVLAGSGLWGWRDRRHRAGALSAGEVLDGQPHQIDLSWPSAPTSILFNVAQQQGFFARYLLDVRLTGGGVTGRDAIGDLQAGRSRVAVAPVLSWLDRLHEGEVQARLVMGLQAGTFRLLVRRRLKLSRVEDMVGRRIAITNPDMADRLFFSVVLRRKGMNPDTGPQWQVLAPQDMAGAIRAGDVDALAVHDPLAWRLLNDPSLGVVELVNSVNGLYAQRTNLALGVARDMLDQDPAAAAALVVALQDAARWLKTHVPETASLLAGHIEGMGPDAIIAMMRHEVLGICPTGHDFRVQLAQYVDEMKLLGRFPDTLDSAGYARAISTDLLHRGTPAP
ncbi:ABC transporter substrate-binding protein [Novacetimonas pomaceti]|uniref:ABC transporter substrate-binding protein n=1 Tax=Novacetimonas pomaceti TaxID=2021998 RepID=UPI001C2D64DA|nr:ABC transporter substrate-binding protein [Novacetimonas pomaceti]MBV1832940.1 ABC transporter substrate-binding protein [Novacetimonas pomaceti]